MADKPMRLYLVERTGRVDYDEYDSYVVAAANADEAVATCDGKWEITHVYNDRNEPTYMAKNLVAAFRPEGLNVRLLGIAINPENTPAHIVHSSFKAG